jgi:sugar lactone lactonase YvrE
LPQASRAIVAGSTDYFGAIKAYKVTVSDTSNSYTSTTVSAGICTIDGIAVAADYAVAVQAYSDTGYATQIASGSASSVIVTAGATTTVPITLSFTQTAASGGYSLKVAWPASMALPYVCAKLDSSAATYTAVQGTSDGTNYTATISASSLSGGAHQLYIYFAATSSSTPLFGPYMESLDIWDGVTDSMWADPSGALHDTLTLTADEFASSNADLAGLSVTNAALSPSFSTGTTSYSLSNFSANAFTFSATLVSGAQNISYKWNSAAGTWTSVVGSAFTSPSLGLVSGSNSLQITVTAPDRQTSTTYTIALSCGAISVGLGVDTSYLGLAFPSSTTIVQGQAFGAETGNPSLDAITSGWTWYLDGVAQGESSQRFVLSPSSTSSMIGNYLVAASVKSGEVTYSGRIVLAVTRKASLSMSPTNANVTTLAGSWTNVGSADGTGAGASFSFPEGITTDGTNLYVADSNNNEIRRIVIATGVVTTLAGSTTSGHADGTGAGASFSFPEGITTDGTNLYVVDGDNNEIRKVVIATGAVTTLAGSWTSGFGNADGTGAAASFSFPQGITTDGTNLYVADFQNNEIRKIVIATAVVTTLAGSGASGHADGTGTAATFNLPHGIATDGTNLYVADCYNNEIRKIVIASRVVTTLAGSYTTAGHADGTGTGASFMFPYDITTDGTNLYVTDQSNNEIRKIVIASKVVTTLAGSTTAGHADDTGTAASFNGPYGITTDGTKLYVADNGNNEIREIQQ